MPTRLTQEEFMGLSPAEQEEHNKRQIRDRKWCHRAFQSHMLAVPTRAAPGLAVPGEQGQAVGLSVQFPPGNQLCFQEECMLWDEKKRRCLDRSALVAQAYGKNQAEQQES